MNDSDSPVIKGNILVVDDTPANLRLLAELLRQRGHQVRAVTTGKMALSSARVKPPDLILLDIVMPGKNGYEICQELKADDRTKHIPVIFLSALNQVWDKVKAFQVGGVDYIPKPFHKEEAIARVEHQLQLVFANRQMRSQNQQLQRFSLNLKHLHRLNTTNYSTLDQVFADYLRTGCKILNLPLGAIAAIEGQDYQILHAQSDVVVVQPQKIYPLAETYCAEVVRTGETIAYRQISELQTILEPATTQFWGLEAYISTPIWVQGKIYGTLSFASPEARTQDFTTHEHEIIELIAQSLGKLIGAYQTDLERQRAEEETQLLLAVTQVIGAAPDFQTALMAALEQVCEASGWSYGEVWIPSLHGTVLECSPAWYCSRSTKRDPVAVAAIAEFRAESELVTFGLNEGLPGRVWFRGQPEYFSPLTEQDDWRFLPQNFTSTGQIKAGLAVPITVPQQSVQVHSVSTGEHPPRRILAVLVFFLVESSVKSFHQDERLVKLVTAVATQLGTVMQRKQAEAELRSLLAAMTDSVLLWNREGRCLRVIPTHANPGFALPPEVLGKTLYELFPKSTADLVFDCLQQTLDSQQPRSIEYSLTLKAGEVWFDAQLSPLSLDTAMCVARDITERKLLEQKLWESEAEMRRVFEAMTDIVVVINPQESSIQVMPTNYVQSCNYSMPLQSQKLQEIEETVQQALTGELQELFYPFIEEVLSTGQPQIIEYNLSLENRQVWFSGTISPLTENTVILVSRDISERKAIEQMKDEFLSIASHELRTPLTSIRGSLGLLATGRLGTLSEQGQRMLQVALNNTERLHRLINDILDLERIESGKIEMVKQVCSANQLISQAAEAMQAMAEEANIFLVLECNDQPLSVNLPTLEVWADPDQILQTLTNLINNAIKFSDSKTSIWIGIVSQEQNTLFYVKDQGRGIPSDHIETIFERFRQVDASDSRKKGGTGLGLPICREIIKRHNGKIWVESLLGEGSTFYFTLPLKTEASEFDPIKVPNRNKTY